MKNKNNKLKDKRKLRRFRESRRLLKKKDRNYLNSLAIYNKKLVHKNNNLKRSKKERIKNLLGLRLNNKYSKNNSMKLTNF
jgi:hypothetical protein